MDSILRGINENNGHKSPKELMETYMYLIDEELNKLYAKTDCVQNYGKYFLKSKVESRQTYHCSHGLCHFSTNKSSLIVRHIRRHIKQKPYLCPIEGCKQRFYQRCDLRCHLMRHFEDKPFRCNQPNCSKSYTTRKALSLHIKSHFPFAFNCNVCHKKFATNWKLNKHSKEQHNISGQLVSETHNNSEPKTETTEESVLRDKTKSKPIAREVPNVPNVKLLTEELIYSVNDINDQMRAHLRSNDRIKSVSAQFGFEEVIQYVIRNCGQPLNKQTVIEDSTQENSEEVSDRMNDSIDSNPEPNKCDSNDLLIKCVQSVESLIEVYTFGSIDGTKYLFKCINCVFTSDTIQTVVSHVWEHISEGVTQCLRNKLS